MQYNENKWNNEQEVERENTKLMCKGLTPWYTSISSLQHNYLSKYIL